MIKLKNKINGLTLIEVLVYITVFALFASFLMMYNNKVSEEVRDIVLINDISKIVEAIDRRIYIEGLEKSNWNRNVWNSNDFRDFLRKELVTADNPQCGLPDGWKPKYNEDLDTSLSKELGDYANTVNKTLSSKLIPCLFWSSYPMDKLQPSMSISSNAQFVETFRLNMAFPDNDSWFKGLVQIRKIENAIKLKSINTSIIKVEFNPKVNNSSVSMESCLQSKSACSFDVVLKVRDDFEESERLRIDSSNSLKKGLRFALTETDTQHLVCNTWEVDSENKWSKSSKACGITGGTMDSTSFTAIGNDSDSDTIRLNIEEDCVSYDGSSDEAKDFTESEKSCGISNDGQVNLNLTYTNTGRDVIRKLRTIEILSGSASVTGVLTSEKGDVIGGDKEREKPATTIAEKAIFKTADLDNRIVPAGDAITINNNIVVDNEINVAREVTMPISSKIETVNLNVKDTAAFHKLSFTGGKVFETNMKVLGDNVLEQINSVEKIYDENGFQVPNLISNLMGVASSFETESIDIEKVLVSTGLTEVNLINATNDFKTEQLAFNKSMNVNGNFNVDNSLSIDGVGPQYTYTNIAGGDKMISGWGARYLGSDNGGFAAKKIDSKGSIIIETPNSGAAAEDNGFFITDQYVTKDARLFELTNEGLFRLRNIAYASDETPIFIGNVFIGNPQQLSRRLTNSGAESSASRLRGNKFIAVVDIKSPDGTIIFRPSDNITPYIRSAIFANSFEINAPNKTLQIIDGIALPCVSGGSYKICPDKMPIKPNGELKEIAYQSDVDSNNKEVWILNSGHKLSDYHNHSIWMRDKFDDYEKRYEAASKKDIPDGGIGHTGARGSQGKVGPRGPTGVQGLAGPVGRRG